jgi:hypothetical protein
MLSFLRVRRLALFVCISSAFIAVSNTPSRAAKTFYGAFQGQKQGSFKGGSPPNPTFISTSTPS